MSKVQSFKTNQIKANSRCEAFVYETKARQRHKCGTSFDRVQQWFKDVDVYLLSNITTMTVTIQPKAILEILDRFDLVKSPGKTSFLTANCLECLTEEILYRKVSLNDQEIKQLILPRIQVPTVLKLIHDEMGHS